MSFREGSTSRLHRFLRCGILEGASVSLGLGFAAVLILDGHSWAAALVLMVTALVWWPVDMDRSQRRRVLEKQAIADRQSLARAQARSRALQDALDRAREAEQLADRRELERRIARAEIERYRQQQQKEIDRHGWTRVESADGGVTYWDAKTEGGGW